MSMAPCTCGQCQLCRVQDILEHYGKENADLRAKVAELKENAKRAWEECHALSSELPKANQDRDRWRECAVYLDYRGADYCVAIHKELDGLQADNAGHRAQMSGLLNEWRARATRAEADLEIMTRARDHEQDMRRQRQAERDEARGRVERLREVAKAATDRLVCDASCPARITGAEVDCTCGLVAVYDALDAALAECGEG